MRKWIVLPLLLAGACGDGNGHGVEASGTVEATEADLGFQAPGRIDSIFVEEGARVTTGQRVAVLDLREAAARRDDATAQLAAQQARLAEWSAGIGPRK